MKNGMSLVFKRHGEQLIGNVTNLGPYNIRLLCGEIA